MNRRQLSRHRLSEKEAQFPRDLVAKFWCALLVVQDRRHPFEPLERRKPWIKVIISTSLVRVGSRSVVVAVAIVEGVDKTDPTYRDPRVVGYPERVD